LIRLNHAPNAGFNVSATHEISFHFDYTSARLLLSLT
jgi:hypothetical protein